MFKVSCYSTDGLCMNRYICKHWYQAIELLAMFSKKYEVSITDAETGMVFCSAYEDGSTYISKELHDAIAAIYSTQVYRQIFNDYEYGHIRLDDNIRELLFNIK